MYNTTSSLSKVLSGINNTLNIMNKAVPLYKEVCPVIKNINNTYKTIKNNKSNLTNTIKLLKIKNAIKKDLNLKVIQNKENKKIELNNNLNNPTFFI